MTRSKGPAMPDSASLVTSASTNAAPGMPPALLLASCIALGEKSTPVASQPCWARYATFVLVPHPRSNARPGGSADGPSTTSRTSGGVGVSQIGRPMRYSTSNRTRRHMIVLLERVGDGGSAQQLYGVVPSGVRRRGQEPFDAACASYAREVLLFAGAGSSTVSGRCNQTNSFNSRAGRRKYDGIACSTALLMGGIAGRSRANSCPCHFTTE